jgi:hypothetical protein
MRSLSTLLCLLAVLLTLGGCAATSRTASATKHHETNTVTGAVQMPATATTPAFAVPVEFTWTKEWVENELVEGESHANIDGAAIGAQAAAVVTAALKQALPALAPVFSSPAPPSDGTTAAAITGAGGLAVLALREFLARRAAQRDGDEAWDHIKNQTAPAPKDT